MHPRFGVGHNIFNHYILLECELPLFLYIKNPGTIQLIATRLSIILRLRIHQNTKKRYREGDL
jgi:hypothetical protein